MQVQAHPSGMLFWQANPSFSILYQPLVVCFLLVHLFVTPVHGQVTHGGQVFTNGLAIVDSPAPKSVVHAGSTMDIAIDISGDGQLPQASETGFDSLAIYLVSSDTSLNLTVSTDPTLLTQQPGSTVKHLKWQAPNCLTPGSYNLTFYEGFHLKGASFFGITPIPLTVENSDQSPVTCPSVNTLVAQPQPFSAPAQSVWLDADTVFSASGDPSQSTSVSSASVASPWTLIPAPSGMSYVPSSLISTSMPPAPTTGMDTITITVGPLGIQWPITIGPPFSPETVVIQPAFSVPPGMVTVVSIAANPTHTTTEDSSGDQGTITVMVSPTMSPTTVTIVLASPTTFTGITTMPGGLTTAFTTLSTSFATTTGVMGMPGGFPDSAGFLPINAVASATSLRHSVFILLPVLFSMYHLV